jgi:dTDP-4-dehydrorhamnose 3,5-epimerase
VIFHATAIAGVWLLEPERHTDERGFLARTYDRDAFVARGLETAIVHCNTSWNRTRGTLRGLHWQVAPFAEAKLVRVTRGAIFDVAVDLRPGSPTRGQHVAVTLTAEQGHQIFIPQGFAHGFQTLQDDTEVFYQLSAAYSGEHARGIRHDDPTLAIPWPEPVTVISARDRALPAFEAG